MMDPPCVEEKPLDAEIKPISHAEAPPEKEVQKKKRKKSKKIPKAKGFPKYYKNGYVRYCDMMRPIVCEEHPLMDPVEVTKNVATKWFALSAEEKQPYMDEAKIDKERFKREVKEFNKQQPTDDLRLPLLKSKKSKMKSTSEAAQKDKSMTSTPTAEPSKPTVSIPIPIKSSSEFLNCELPIFTDTFLDHNKCIEAELKMLRRSNLEMDQQNSLLMKHIENMDNGVRKVEAEIAKEMQQNNQYVIYLTKLKCSLSSRLNSLAVPGFPVASIENIENYLSELSTAAISSPSLLNKASDIIRKTDLKFSH